MGEDKSQDKTDDTPKEETPSEESTDEELPIENASKPNSPASDTSSGYGSDAPTVRSDTESNISSTPEVSPSDSDTSAKDTDNESETSRDSQSSAQSSVQQNLQGLDDDDVSFMANRRPKSYDFLKLLGSGGYSMVYLAVDRKDQNFKVAIKVCKDKVGNTSSESIKCEMLTITQLKKNPHQYIVNYYAMAKHPNHMRVYFVSELAELGDLFEAIQVTNKTGERVMFPLIELHARHLIKGIALGVRHMHRIGVAHGDLKLENVLVFWSKHATHKERALTTEQVLKDFKGSIYKWTPKLTDFTNSITGRTGDPPGSIMNDWATCTLDYAAPEMYGQQNPCIYDAVMADSYSLGVCLLMLVLGANPFSNPMSANYPNDPNTSGYNEMIRAFTLLSCRLKQNHTYLRHITRHLSYSLKVVLQKLLHWDPVKRMPVNEFLNDQWLTGSGQKSRSMEHRSTSRDGDSDQFLSAPEMV